MKKPIIDKQIATTTLTEKFILVVLENFEFPYAQKKYRSEPFAFSTYQVSNVKTNLETVD